MRTTRKKTADALRPAIIVATGVATAALVLHMLVTLTQTMPKVGDIVVFAPSTTLPIDDGTRLLVHRQDQFGCVLDLDVLHRSGGSLVIESQFGANGNTFYVHWAGGRTSDDPGNCGSEADLIVDTLDLNALSFSVGGYGLNPPGKPILISDVVR